MRRRFDCDFHMGGRQPYLRSRLAVAVVASLVGAGIASIAWALATADGGGPNGSGEVTVTYQPGPREAERLVERSGLFDATAATINREIELNHDLEVRVIGDRAALRKGIGGPQYEPSEHVVYIPWSFIVQAHADVAALREAGHLRHAEIDEIVGHAMQFVLYHELSHGIIDELDVPVLAGEERAADSLATVLSLHADTGGEALPLSAAVLELASAERAGPPALSDFADDHGFDRQRAFDAICAVYGSSPADHRGLLTGPNALPAARAELCPYDYERLVRDWRRTLASHLTLTGGLLPPGYEAPPPAEAAGGGHAKQLEGQLNAPGSGSGKGG